jgi:hypothetical protein
LGLPDPDPDPLVKDPDPDPSLLSKCVERIEIMLEIKLLRLKIMCLLSYKKKI